MEQGRRRNGNQTQIPAPRGDGLLHGGCRAKKDEDGGKIVQRGTHDELIQEDGIYADFVGGKKETAGWKLKKRKKSAERFDLSALFWYEDSYGGAPVRKWRECFCEAVRSLS